MAPVAIVRFLRSRWFRLIVTVVSLFLMVGLVRSIIDVWSRRTIVAEREAVLARVKGENEALKRKLAQAQTPEFIEREARNKLNMGKDGETVVLIGKTRVSDRNDQQKTNEASASNWQQWWRLFF